MANVEERQDWEPLVKTARKRYGGVDVVVDNAGTSEGNMVRYRRYRLLSHWWCSVIAGFFAR